MLVAVAESGDVAELVAVLVGDNDPVELLVEAVLLGAKLLVVVLVGAGPGGVVDAPGVAFPAAEVTDGDGVVVGAMLGRPCCSGPAGTKTGDPWPKC